MTGERQAGVRDADRWRVAYRKGRLSFWADDETTITRRLSKMGMKELAPESRILDVGCGAGHLLRHLAARGFRDCWGLEIDRELFAQSDMKERVASGTATVLPFEDESFDGILFMAVLHHLEGDAALERCLSEVFRVLRPGGLVAYSEPADTVVRSALTRLLLSPLASLSAFARSKRVMVLEERENLRWWLSIEREVPDRLARLGFAEICVRRESLKTYVVARKGRTLGSA